MAVFPVRPEKQKALKKNMEALGIHEKDLEEKFILPGGPGGQKADKASTAVYLKHLPTGVEVKSSKARTQGLNRYHARVELVRKIGLMIKREESPEMKRREKIRRAKEKKRQRARKKYQSLKTLS